MSVWPAVSWLDLGWWLRLLEGKLPEGYFFFKKKCIYFLIESLKTNEKTPTQHTFPVLPPLKVWMGGCMSVIQGPPLAEAQCEADQAALHPLGWSQAGLCLGTRFSSQKGLGQHMVTFFHVSPCPLGA